MGFDPGASETFTTARCHYSKLKKSKLSGQELDVLSGCQNKACAQLYNLPVMGEDHAEPCVWVSNHAVLESIEMRKEDGHVNTWRANKDHLICMRNAFNNRT